MRAWVNMGISYSNIADYPESAKYYIQVRGSILSHNGRETGLPLCLDAVSASMRHC